MTVRLTATLLTYGEDSQPDFWGDVITFAPGSLFTDTHQKVGLFVEHDTSREAAGYAVDIWTEGKVVRGTFETIDTPSGRLLEQELLAGVRRHVSVGVYLDEYTDEPLDPATAGDPWAPIRMTVTSGDLAETSACIRGRFPSAAIDEVTPVEGNPA